MDESTIKKGESVKEQLSELKSEGHSDKEILAAMGYLYSQGKTSWRQFILLARKMGINITYEDECELRKYYGIPEDKNIDPYKPPYANPHRPKGE